MVWCIYTKRKGKQMTTTTAIWEIKAIEWTADDGSTVYSYYAEGMSETAGWFCFEVDTLDELAEELTVLGFEPTPHISVLPRVV